MPSLRKLSLQSNRLTSMMGLEGCTSLEELYLSHNGIQQMEVLALKTLLTSLHLPTFCKQVPRPNLSSTVEGLS